MRLLSFLVVPSSASMSLLLGPSSSTRDGGPWPPVRCRACAFFAANARGAQEGAKASAWTSKKRAKKTRLSSGRRASSSFGDEADGRATAAAPASLTAFATSYHAPVMWKECTDALLGVVDDNYDCNEEDDEKQRARRRRSRHRTDEDMNGDPDDPDGGGGGDEDSRALAKQAADSYPSRIFVDGTLGGGGHSHALLERLGAGDVVYGCDVDPMALRTAAERLRQYAVTDPRDSVGGASDGSTEEGRPLHSSRGPQLITVASNFAHLHTHPEFRHLWGRVDGILLDLGVSSHQIDTVERGFTFSQADGPLDMRMNPGPLDATSSSSLRACDLCNELDVDELARILKSYADEPRAKAIARSIVDRRPLRTTGDLQAAVAAVTPAYHKESRRKGRTATLARVFQAFRIVVNQEDEMLERALTEMAPTLLKPGGRLVVLSYHSLEDRPTKRVMRDGSIRKNPTLQQRDLYGNLVTARPFRPVGKALKASQEEVAANPRARSAVLRVAERI